MYRYESLNWLPLTSGGSLTTVGYQIEAPPSRTSTNFNHPSSSRSEAYELDTLTGNTGTQLPMLHLDIIMYNVHTGDRQL